MEKIKIYKVCADFDGEIFEFAVCTSMEYAEKAVERLVNENGENENELYIEEDEIILNAIYGWDDGDLTV